MSKRCYIELSTEKDILWHQIDTIAYNTQLNIYEPVVIQREKRQYLFFDTENDTSLRTFFKQNRVTGNFIKELILNICLVLVEAEGFLLSKNNFKLDVDYIFMDSGFNAVKLIYLPVIDNTTFDLKKLIADILFNLAEISEGDGLLTPLREYIKSGTIALEKVIEICRDNSAAQEKYNEEESWEDPFENSQEEKEKVKPNININRIVPAIGVILIYLLEFTPLINYIDFFGNYTKSVLIGGVVLLELIYFIPMILFERKNKQPRRIEQVEEEIIIDDKTLDLRSIEKPLAFLVEKNCANPMKSEINSEEFYIGRSIGVNDMVCNNKAVGKKHAKIFVKDSKFYITDLGSKNGTFINGVRIDEEQKNELKNGDVVSIANVNLSFFCIST